MSLHESSLQSIPAHRTTRLERRLPLLIAAWVQSLASFGVLALAVISSQTFGPGTWTLGTWVLWALLLTSGVTILRGRTPLAWSLAILVQLPLLLVSLATFYATTRFAEGTAELLGVFLVLTGASLTALLYLLRPRTRLQYGAATSHALGIRLPRSPAQRAAFFTGIGLTLLIGQQTLLYCLLWDAVNTHDGASVSRYIRCGAPLGWCAHLERDTPLTVAARYDDVEVTQALLAGGARVDEEKVGRGTPLEAAITGGKIENARLLLAYDADPNRALPIAMETGNLALIKLLVGAGANLNVPSSGGSYPLAQAADRGDRQLAELLLKPGQGLRVRGGPGAEDLLRTVVRGDVAGVRGCLANGVDPETSDAGGFTALMAASAFNRLEAARALLAAGASINARDHQGHTALYWAIPNGDTPMVRLLLNHQPDLSVLDSRGETLLDRARLRGTDDVTLLLRSAGAAGR